MATLIDFSSAYNGEVSFYTGTGNSVLVPDLYPVAIAGHNYLVDQKSGRFGRAFEARVRESVDQNNIPGEATINPQGLWRRAQASWHKGSGQQYADTADGLDTRFDTSKNVDPWTKGELKLLKATTQVYSSAASNLLTVVSDNRLYVADGQTLKYTTDLSNYTTVTGGPTADITAMATDGSNIYVAYTGDGIHITTSSTSTLTHYVGGTETYTTLEYVKGRLMAGHNNDIHNFTSASPSTHPTPTHVFTNTEALVTGFAAGQQHIYVGVKHAHKSLIYRIEITQDGTSLDAPVQAGELPDGETVTMLYGYLGYIVIGTDYGIRLATSDTNGNLVIGPVLETPHQVKCAIGDSRFVWYGWSNFDGTSTGLGRIDLSELTGVNEPAYASDLMADSQGAVNSVVTWEGRRLFSVASDGIYAEHATDLAAEGYCVTGTWRWGIPDRKFLPRFDVRCKPLKGTITPSVNLDSAGYNDLTAITTLNLTDKTVPGPQTGFSEAAIKLTLTRSATDNTLGPTVTRWQARAYAAPIRARVFSIPIILHKKLNLHGREVYQDVSYELAFLENLVNDASIVLYQDAYDSYNVLVENVEWIPLNALDHGWEFEGTAVVTLKSIAE